MKAALTVTIPIINIMIDDALAVSGTSTFLAFLNITWCDKLLTSIVIVSTLSLKM